MTDRQMFLFALTRQVRPNPMSAERDAVVKAACFYSL